MTTLLKTLLMVLPFVLPGCSKHDDGPPHKLAGSLLIDGLERTFLLNLPPGFYESDSLPLVIVLHGTGGNAWQAERDYGWTRKSDAAGFVVVYPEGVQNDGYLRFRTWNAGTCCDFAAQQQIDDVKYISTLIDTLISRYRINPARVYVTGMSNGAMLAYRLACEIPYKLAAIAPVSGTLMTDMPCQPSKPVPVLHIHSLLDTKVPYQGGIGLANYYFTPVDSALNVWAGLNGCAAGPEIMTDNSLYLAGRWTGCSGETTVEYYLTRDGGHSWPGGLKPHSRADEPSQALDATAVIWDFFQRYP